MKTIYTFKQIQRLLIVVTTMIFFGVYDSDSIAQPGWFSQSSGTNHHLTSVYFVNSNIGWVVGDHGLILKTINGGTNWFQQSSEALNKLMSVCFTDINTGWAVGYAATIRKTTNGGTNWFMQSAGPAWLPWSVHFYDDNTGWIVCEFGIIMKTTNGGTNWFTQESGTNADLYSVHFADNNSGWAVGGGGTILRTTNGGTNWTIQTSGTGIELRSVYCIDSNTGWTVGGSILKTTDGGANWITNSYGSARSVYFANDSIGWIVGYNGTIVNTTNSGVNWTLQSSGTGELLWSVQFININTGWAVGTFGCIIKTTTGGNLNPPPEPFCGPGPHFVDNCSAATDSLNSSHNCETQAMIRISTDTSDNCNVPSNSLPILKGPTIVSRSEPKDTSGKFPGVALLDGHSDIIDTELKSMDLRSFAVSSNGDTVFFRIIAGAGNAIGPCGNLLLPTYGYIHELPANSNSGESIFDLYFELKIEDPHGVIGSPNPEYYIYNQTPVRIGAVVDRIPPRCGWNPVTNEYYTIYKPDENTCLKLYSTCIPNANDPPIAKIIQLDFALPVELTTFSSSLTGNELSLNWTTSSEINNEGFVIERMSESNWIKIGFVAGKGKMNTTSYYTYTDRDLLSGIYHYRLKQIDFNGNFEYFNLSETVTIGVPNKFFLDQNYPNPFNPVTQFVYGMPEAGNVKLKIFDISGREIKTLVSEFKEAGYYTTSFDAGGLASGAYFYRIESGKYYSVKKMILLK